MFGLVNEPLFHTTSSSYGMTSDKAKHLGETYSILMTRVIDAIRNTGAQQVIFVDRPDVWYLSNIQPIYRDNMVWEDHRYVTVNTPTVDMWKDSIDKKVQRFVYDFGKSLFIGEYGIDPYSLIRDEPLKSIWKSVISEQVAHLDSKPLCGRQWHQWAALEGEYYDFTSNYFTATDSDYIIQTVLGDSPTTGGCSPSEHSIGQDGCSAGQSCCCK